jgi:DNA-binding response OmpR family regulator
MPVSSNEGNIMVVDDNPTNLGLLEDMLRQHGFEVRLFPRGRMALAAAAKEPPDLFLLDINMPELSGYQVCEQLKWDEKLASIPVIFLSALNDVEDKVKGFAAGGVDYITKPFQFEEVLARVGTHLELRRARRRERDLLETTLSRAMALLGEVVHLASPTIAARADAMGAMVSHMAGETRVTERWRYDLAGRLCLLGCLAVPEDVFDRAYRDQKLSADEDRMVRMHPETGARLVANIPRLESVAEMIRHQQTAEKGSSPADPALHGAHMLRVASEVDRRMYHGLTIHAALAQLKASQRYDIRMLEALATFSPPEPEFVSRSLFIRELRDGMILEENIYSEAGNLLILKENTVLTKTWIERLANFASMRQQQLRLNVRIRSAGGSGDRDPAARQAGNTPRRK